MSLEDRRLPRIMRHFRRCSLFTCEKMEYEPASWFRITSEARKKQRTSRLRFARLCGCLTHPLSCRKRTDAGDAGCGADQTKEMFGEEGRNEGDVFFS